MSFTKDKTSCINIADTSLINSSGITQMNDKIIYFKNFASEIDYKYYNSQEIGLCRELVDKGYDCDIISYSKQESEEVVYENGVSKLILKRVNAFKFLSNAVYFTYLNKKKLNEYKFIITTEYNQIMTYFLSKICPGKTFLYHGPYADNGRKIVQLIFDSIFRASIIKNLGYTFTKSNLACDYLRNKGFKDIESVGVGLNSEMLSAETSYNNDSIEKSDSRIKKILYVGQIEERKNIFFIAEILAKLKSKIDFLWIIVGSGEPVQVENLMSKIEDFDLKRNVVIAGRVEQRDIRYFYEKADVLVLPSLYEIFGMVILESSYFGTPVLSSVNGGASHVIDNYENGLVISGFDSDRWADELYKILTDDFLYEKLSRNAEKKVKEFCTWKKIAEKIIDKAVSV